MSTSLRRRLRAIEKKAYKDDEIHTLTLGDVTYPLTLGQLRKAITAAQGTYLKPVTCGGSSIDWSKYGDWPDDERT